MTGPTDPDASRPRSARPAGAAATIAVAGAIAYMGLALAGCSRDPAAAVEPLPVDAPVEPTADAPVNAPEDGSLPGAGDADATVGGRGAGPGGLWVVDATNDPIGVLIQRGHPWVGEGLGVDPLLDGALVYAPGAGLFFAVALATGEVLAPRVAVKDSDCQLPAVAGYYADGDEESGRDMAFVFAGKWFRIKAGEGLQLVPCQGITKPGAGGICVKHSGSCRGFPVEKIAVDLPTSFAAPMRFAWLGQWP